MSSIVTVFWLFADLQPTVAVANSPSSHESVEMLVVLASGVDFIVPIRAGVRNFAADSQLIYVPAGSTYGKFSVSSGPFAFTYIPPTQDPRAPQPVAQTLPLTRNHLPRRFAAGNSRHTLIHLAFLVRIHDHSL
jgi:hypothetical protein